MDDGGMHSGTGVLIDIITVPPRRIWLRMTKREKGRILKPFESHFPGRSQKFESATMNVLLLSAFLSKPSDPPQPLPCPFLHFLDHTQKTLFWRQESLSGSRTPDTASLYTHILSMSAPSSTKPREEKQCRPYVLPTLSHSITDQPIQTYLRQPAYNQTES